MLIGKKEHQERAREPARRRLRIDRFDVFSVGVLMALYVTVALLPFAPKAFGDQHFHVEAKQLALAVHGAVDGDTIAFTKAPVPVLYYAVPYLFVPPGAADAVYWLAGFLWNLAWMVLCLVLLRRIGDALGGRLAGYVAVLLTLASPFNVYYSYGILAEPPAYLGVCLALYGWVRWQRAQGEAASGRLGRGLLWLGLALFVLSRPNGVLVLGLMALAALVLWRKQTPEHRAVVRLTLQSILVTVIVGVVVLTLVNLLPGRDGERHQGDYLVHVVFHGRFQYRTEPWDWRFWGDKYRQGSEDYAAWVRQQDAIDLQAEETGISVADLRRAWIIDDWIEHPEVTLQAAAVRLLSLHIAFVSSVKPESFQVGPISGRLVYGLFHIAVNVANLLLVVGTLWFFVRWRGRLASYWILWGPWLALLGFHALTYAEPRYLFPARPGLVVMAALVIASLLPKRWQALGRTESVPKASEPVRATAAEDGAASRSPYSR